ncbi:MAG: excinuclease ABC subunit UvrC [Planctomycetes bacterium]|nr:excinuclease ABC subunit UvrC [Planctomycetota bacterium]
MQEFLSKLPDKPGVYLMKDKNRKVIYIGKAKVLCDRVKSYFTDSSGHDPKTAKMVSEIKNIEYITTGTEIEAIFLESRLIKDIKPKYNVMLKDDKSFSTLVITDYDDFPKVWITHETDDAKGIKFGPFVSGVDLRKSIKVLQKIFKFATCSLIIKESDRQRRYFRPCLLYHINQCYAPCTDAISQFEYTKTIDNLIAFLKGNKDELIERLTSEMQKESKDLNFERAAGLRDQIESLKTIDELLKKYVSEGDIGPMSPAESNAELNRLLNTKDSIHTIEALDISHIQGHWSVGSIVRFRDGVPYKQGYRRYKIKTIKGIDDYAMIEEVLTRRIKRGITEQDLPDLFLIDGGKGQLESAKKVVKELRPSKQIALLSLAKREETVFHYEQGKLNIAKNNQGLRLLMYARDEAHRFAKNYHMNLRKKSIRQS